MIYIDFQRFSLIFMIDLQKGTPRRPKKQNKVKAQFSPQSGEGTTEKPRSTATKYSNKKTSPKGRRFTNEVGPQGTETLSVDTQGALFAMRAQKSLRSKT